MADGFSGYYLGIDAGNSKTHALIADSRGQAVGLYTAGPGNWESIGLDGARAVYQQALDGALAEAGLRRADLCAAGYGLAGYDFPSDDARLRPVVESLGVPGPCFLDNDSLIGLRAGTSKPYGVVCISGSGSTKAGRNRRGETFRTWGLAASMGDWGGGGDIAQAAIGAVACAAKGIEPPTALTEPILQHFGAPDVTALMEKLTRAHEYRIDFVPLVFEVAAAGDAAARSILIRAGRDLARSTNAVIRALDMADEEFELVLAGSVFKATYPLMVDTLSADVRAVAPRVQIVRLTTPPVVGAVLLAMEAADLTPDDSVRLRLQATVQARLGQTV